ncbi:MAG: histidine triad nucleotide-binding protein [Tissierellia bacterium]|nr:histidine triad nucleotide-binding protein [Tissierellia bacterium]
MNDCIFCKIANGEIPSKIVYEDDRIIAFEDMNPQAPTHILVIPKKHIAHIDELETKDNELIGYIYEKIGDLSRELGLKEGFRVVLNNKSHGGQTVNHVHFHLLGGRSLQWPPG